MSFAACMADGNADIDMKTDLVWGLLRLSDARLLRWVMKQLPVQGVIAI